MVRRLVMMCAHPRNLRFQQGDPAKQFVLRIGVQAFPLEGGGGIQPRPRQIIIVHVGNIMAHRLAVNAART